MSMDLHNSPIAASDSDQLNVNDVRPDHPLVDSAGTTQPTISLVSTPTITSAPADSQAQHADVDMDDVEYDDMPGLQDVTDSSNSDYDDDDDDSDVEAREVEMQAMHVDDDPPLLPLPQFVSHHASPSPSPRNRRARVEDDEDNDRDRRHPSHRIGAGNNNPRSTPNMRPIPTAQTHPEQTSPPNDLTFTIMNGFLSYNVGPDLGVPALQQAQPGAPAQPGATAQPGAGGETPETQANPNQIPLPNDTLHGILLRLRDMLSDAGPFRTIPFTLGRGFGFDEPEPEDPERAKKLVDGLEEVPVGLVRRLVRVGGTGGGMGYDDNKGGDSGCAICWDTLLDSEGEGFGKQPEAATEVPDLETKKQPKIVSLPCAHVFHADCLIPWFSRPRHTTCPTCRFNIDPDNLTYAPELRRRGQQEQGQGEATRTTDGAPPVAETTTPQVPTFSVERDFLNWIPAAHPPANTAEPNPSAPTVPPSLTTATAVPEPNADAAGPTSDGQQTSMSFQTPNGFVTVTQVLTPFELHPQGGNPGHPNGPISIPFPQAQAPNPGLVPQPQTQSEPVPAGGQPQPQATEAQPGEPGNTVPGPRTQAPLPPLPNHTPMPNFPRMFSPFDLFARRPPTNPTNATPAAPAPGTTPTNDATQAPTPADPASTNNPPDQPDFMQVTFDMVIGPWPPFGPGGQPLTAPQAPSGAPQNAGATPPAPIAPGQTPDQQVPLTPAARVAETLDVELRDVLAALRANVETREGSQSQPQPLADEPPAQTEDDSSPILPLEEDTQRLLAETRRNVDVFLSRMMQFRRPAPQGPGEAPVDAQRQGEQQQQQANPNQHPQVPVGPNTAQPPPPPPQVRFQTFPNFDFLGGASGREERPKRPWTLPPAPGPSLRQRVERREFEAGLRCSDISCGVGPSDEEPFPSAVADNAGASKRLFIKTKAVGGKDVCSHAFHGACLVSAERVAMRGMEVAVDSDGCVEVSCPVCRGVGCVLKEEWDEGVVALQ